MRRLNAWADSKDPLKVAVQILEDYRALFPDATPDFVPRVFGWLMDAFEGRMLGYLPIDTGYHDLEHMLQGTLCLSQLLRGRSLSGELPVLSRRTFELAIIAVFLHDTWYLKEVSDVVGTGAKYTHIHVLRSCEFASDLLRVKEFFVDEIEAVQNMIRCTAMGVNIRMLRFASEEERIAGCSVGTADLLGQMAADDYVEKLPALFEEFEESRQYQGQAVGAFLSVDDLKRKTPKFWKNYVLPKIEGDFEGVFRFLRWPEAGGENLYLERIETSIARLEAVMALRG
ncbi:MAG: hypothetical protein EXS25_01245 [Pedosphaera sp.]|nr:hypothetical protein [Pedosphaera sp.]